MAEVLYVLNFLERHNELNVWHIRDRSNPFEMDETLFIKYFRLSKAAVMDLCVDIRPYMNICNYSYSLEIQVLSVLHVLGSGSFQHVASDGSMVQASQATISRSMNRVLDAIMHIATKYIKFPTTDIEIMTTARGFYDICGFPNVIGAIDCSHINITRPRVDDWFVYLNRKSRFSINVQMVCDAQLKITNVVARWPGSSHDSFIWQHSGLKHGLSNQHMRGNGYLLGDSGYPLEPWLLTPFPDPCCPSENIYNEKHIRTRNCIERCFGVLKSRFRVLHETGGTLLYSPAKVCKIVMCSSVLHNICIQYRVPNIDDDEVDESCEENADIILATINSQGPGIYTAAVQLRNEIAARFQLAR